MLQNLLATVLGEAAAGGGDFGQLMDPVAANYQPATYPTAPTPVAPQPDYAAAQAQLPGEWKKVATPEFMQGLGAPVGPGHTAIPRQELSPAAKAAYARRGLGLQELLGGYQMQGMPQVATPENSPNLFQPPLQLATPKPKIKPPPPPPEPGPTGIAYNPAQDPMNFVGGL